MFQIALLNIYTAFANSSLCIWVVGDSKLHEYYESDTRWNSSITLHPARVLWTKMVQKHLECFVLLSKPGVDVDERLPLALCLMHRDNHQ